MSLITPNGNYIHSGNTQYTPLNTQNTLGGEATCGSYGCSNLVGGRFVENGPLAYGIASKALEGTNLSHTLRGSYAPIKYVNENKCGGKKHKTKRKKKISSKRMRRKRSVTYRRKSRKTGKNKRGCVRKYTKKYVSRNSPPYPANRCPGRKMMGNDGKMYLSRKIGKSKSFKWVKQVKKGGGYNNSYATTTPSPTETMYGKLSTPTTYQGMSTCQKLPYNHYAAGH